MNIDRNSVALPIIRFGFVVAGIIAIYTSINDFLPHLTIMMQTSYSGSFFEEFTFYLPVTIAPLCMLALAFVLIRYCDFFARKILPVEAIDLPKFEAAIYRVAFTGCGVLVLSWALPTAVLILTNFTMLSADQIPSEWEQFVSQSTWPQLVYFGVQTALAVYLIVGAPHFVKWQVARNTPDVESEDVELEEDESVD